MTSPPSPSGMTKLRYHVPSACYHFFSATCLPPPSTWCPPPPITQCPPPAITQCPPPAVTTPLTRALRLHSLLHVPSSCYHSAPSSYYHFSSHQADVSRALRLLSLVLCHLAVYGIGCRVGDSVCDIVRVHSNGELISGISLSSLSPPREREKGRAARHSAGRSEKERRKE